MKKMEVFSWEDMDRLHRQIADEIRLSGYSPEVIVGIQRCGLVPAVHLAYLLELRDVESIQVITTESDEILANRDITPIVNFAPKVPLENKCVLLVDAVVDTGTTVNLCKAELDKHMVKEVLVAAISDWPHSSYSLKFGSSRPKVDFYGVKSTHWPDFPWEH